jgi:F0F1-type ATP synthase assembly protein I
MATVPHKKSVWVLASEYTSLAFMLPAATFVGYAIGYGLDHLFGTSFLRIVFLIAGIASGFLQLIRQYLRDTRDRENG